MDDTLNILPPDKEIFHEKKPTSNKQKEHLVKARAAARETIERRRRLEREEKEREEQKGKVVDLSTDEKILKDDESSGEESPPPVRKPKKKSAAKYREMTEEEMEGQKFEEFMKQMKNYERAKEQHKKDQEEAKKVKFSLNQDEFTYIQGLIEADEKREALAKQNPVAPKKPQPEPAQQQALVRNIKFHSGVNNRSRFGR